MTLGSFSAPLCTAPYMAMTWVFEAAYSGHTLHNSVEPNPEQRQSGIEMARRQQQQDAVAVLEHHIGVSGDQPGMGMIGNGQTFRAVT